MEKKMVIGYIGTTIKIHSFIPSQLKASKPQRERDVGTVDLAPRGSAYRRAPCMAGF